MLDFDPSTKYTRSLISVWADFIRTGMKGKRHRMSVDLHRRDGCGIKTLYISGFFFIQKLIYHAPNTHKRCTYSVSCSESLVEVRGRTGHQQGPWCHRDSMLAWCHDTLSYFEGALPGIKNKQSAVHVKSLDSLMVMPSPNICHKKPHLLRHPHSFPFLSLRPSLAWSSPLSLLSLLLSLLQFLPCSRAILTPMPNALPLVWVLFLLPVVVQRVRMVRGSFIRQFAALFIDSP